MFITLSIVYVQISNTYLPEFLNILFYFFSKIQLVVYYQCCVLIG